MKRMLAGVVLLGAAYALIRAHHAHPPVATLPPDSSGVSSVVDPAACGRGGLSSDGRCVGAGGASNDEVRKKIIAESLRDYPGPCPCPEYLDHAGHRCGRRSAWSRPGGYAPKCYPSDVSDQDVADFRRSRP